MSVFERLTCGCCEKVLEIPYDAREPIPVHELRLYKAHGWVKDEDVWYCPDHRPVKLQVDVLKHPHYSSWRDYWEQRPKEKWESCFFENEPYDHYADRLQNRLCMYCRFYKLGFEDDNSSWSMCCVDDPKDSYGHNLSQGHFYGRPIGGRICPYFTCGVWWEGRDPAKDKENGTFHVPYNEHYDGD